MRKNIENIIMGIVGEEKHARTEISTSDHANLQNALLAQHVTGYNQALADIRSHVPEAAGEIVDIFEDLRSRIHNNLSFELRERGFKADDIVGIIMGLDE